MKYICFLVMLALLSCNTSSSANGQEGDSAKVDGTRLADTLPSMDSLPPGVQNPQPD